MSSKSVKRLISAVLSASMLASLAPGVYADYDSIDEETLIAELQSYSDDYPDGGFAFRESQLEVYENDGSMYIDVVRMGSFDGEASVSFKAIDVSAIYGQDYTLTVEEGRFIKRSLEQDEDAVPLMELYADMDDEVELGRETEPEEADNVINMVVDAENGIVSADLSTSEEIDDTEEDIVSENAENEIVSEDTEESENTEAIEEAEAPAEAAASGLKAARAVYTGKDSDRESWQELKGSGDNAEAAELVSEMSESNGYIGEFAAGMPGTECTLHFGDGEYLKRIKVELVDDDFSETDEQVIFLLYDSEGAELAKPSTAYLNILDDDENEPVVFAMAEENITVTPAEGYARVTVERISGVEKFASVTLKTGAIDAEQDKDYTAGSVEVIFPQGVTQKTVKVPVYNMNRSEPVSFVLAIDPDSSNSDEERSATVVTILPDYSEESLELYSELLSAASGENKSVEVFTAAEDDEEEVSLMSSSDTYIDTYTTGFTNASISSPTSGTDYSSNFTIKSGLDLRNATGVTIYYTLSGSYNNTYTYKDGCKTKTGTETKYGKEVVFTVGGKTGKGSTSSNSSSGSVSITGFSKATGQTIQAKVKRTDSANQTGSVTCKITKIEIEYNYITISVDNTAYAGYNTYTEKVYSAGSSSTDQGLGYTNGNVIKLGEAKVNGSTQAAVKKLSSSITLSVADSTLSNTTSQGVKANIGTNVYLAGWQVLLSNNTYDTTIIAPDQLTLNNLYTRYKQLSYTIRPVFYPYSSVIRFNNTYSNGLAYTNNIKKGTEIGVTMLDTLKVEGVSVNNSGYAVESFLLNGYSDATLHSTTGNTRATNANSFRTTASNSAARKTYLDKYKSGKDTVNATTNSSDTSSMIVMPNCEAIYIDMSYTTPSITVKYNPSSSVSTEYEDKGSVFYWDTNTEDAKNSVSGDYKTPMIIQPVTFGQSYQINAVYSDSGEQAISDYKTIWDDFTGDEDGNGHLTLTEQNALAKFGLNRSSVTGDLFEYQPKVTNSLIYYHFAKRMKSSGSGTIAGTVMLEDYPIFGGEKTVTPLNGATVSVDGLTTTTAEDEDFGNGYFSISDRTFLASETHRVTVVYGPLSISAAQNVNVDQNYVLKAYDTISINTASRAKNGEALAETDLMYTDDADYTLTFATNSSVSALVATKARLTFYRNDGSYITEREYTSTGENTGVFDCTFNPATLQLSAGGKITVTFIDNEGTEYFEHDTGITLMQSLGAISLLTSFAGGAAPALQVIGSVSSAFNFGWDGNLDDSTGEIGDDGEYGSYSITTTEDSKVLNLSLKFSKDDDGDDDKEEAKSAAESGTSAEKKAAAEKVDSGKNETKSELAVGYKVSLSFGLTLTLKASQEEGHTGEWYFEEFMLVANAAGEVSASKSFVTPIGIPVIVGGKIGASGSAIIVIERRLGSAEYYMADLPKGSNGSVDLINTGQSYSDYMYVYGDFTIEPYIGLSAGVGVSQFNVTLSGEAKFSFNFNTKTKVNTGDVTFTCTLSIKILIFESSWTLGSETVSLFDAEETLYESLDGFEVSEREYLKNRSKWNSRDEFSTASVSNLNETTLMTGVNPNTDTKLMSLGDGKYIAVFVDDVPSRTNSNSMAVYYSIYNGSEWSEPEIIEDDGTNDDAPAVYDLENGSLFIAWSTANSVFDDDPNMLDMLNSRNVHGVFFDKSTQTFSEIIEISRDTDEDVYADTDVQIAYDENTARLLIYYTKSEYAASDNEEGVYGDAVYPYSLITYRIYDMQSGEFLDYSAEEEAEIKANLAAQGETDIDAAYEEYCESYYGQRFLELAPTVIVSESLDDNGYWEAEPEISEYAGENDPLVVESDAISYNGLSLFAYILDYDGDKSTTDDRDIFLQIYNFDEDSVTHSIMLTSNDVEESALHFERIGGQVTYLSYLSGDEIKMFNISDNISNDAVTVQSETASGVPYYYLNKTSDAGYLPETAVVRAEASGDYTGELQITDFDLRSNEDYFYIMFTERTEKLKDGIEENSEESLLAQNRLIETQVYMMRYDIENNQFTTPVQVTKDTGANYANVAFAAAGNGFVAMATRSESTTELCDGVEILTADEENSKLCAITFTPEASISARNAQMAQIQAGTDIYASIDVYNGGIETIDGITVEITDDNGRSLDPVYEYSDDTEGSSLSLIGGEYRTVSFAVPVDEDAASAGFTAVVKDADGNTLDTISLSDTAVRSADVATFNASIADRGVLKFSAVIANNELVSSGERTFTISSGDKVLYTAAVESLKPGETMSISDEFEVDYNTLFVSVVNEDGSVSANADLTASAGGIESSNTVSLYASSEQMARFNAVESVDFAVNPSVSIVEEQFLNLAPSITVGEYNGRYEDNNEEEIEAQGVGFTYFSSDEDVVKVYSNGYIEGVGEGTATVTAILKPSSDMYDETGYIDNYPTMPDEAMKVYTFEITVAENNLLEGAIAITTEDTSVEVTVSQEAAESDGMLITAFYDKDGVFLSAETEQLGEMTEFTYPLDGENIYTIKAFIWNSLDEMYPVAQSVSKTVIE